jgi:hypothetical protein
MLFSNLLRGWGRTLALALVMGSCAATHVVHPYTTSSNGSRALVDSIVAVQHRSSVDDFREEVYDAIRRNDRDRAYAALVQRGSEVFLREAKQRAHTMRPYLEPNLRELQRRQMAELEAGRNDNYVVSSQTNVPLMRELQSLLLTSARRVCGEPSFIVPRVVQVAPKPGSGASEVSVSGVGIVFVTDSFIARFQEQPEAYTAAVLHEFSHFWRFHALTGTALAGSGFPEERESSRVGLRRIAGEDSVFGAYYRGHRAKYGSSHDAFIYQLLVDIRQRVSRILEVEADLSGARLAKSPSWFRDSLGMIFDTYGSPEIRGNDSSTHPGDTTRLGALEYFFSVDRRTDISMCPARSEFLR